jgi:ABC-2 type transport system ATP-binding protein|tara:strand:+ start:2272 stop:3021 length:750 start_codon:yes stop_codon:yes gene_type:complete
VLQIEKLSKRFGDVLAVDEISLNLPQGSVVGFLGPNGAGKSTTMRMVSGYLFPDSGTVRICGWDIVRDRQKAQACLGYLPEAPNGFSRLTVHEFLSFCGQARGLDMKSLGLAIDQACQRIDLGPALRRPLGELSKGWRQRAWLAQAILHEPPVLVLDEPTDGLDPNQKEVVRRLVREMSADRTIVLSTHILEEAEELCDHVVVMANGCLVADDPVSNLLDNSGRLGAAFARLTSNDGPVIQHHSQDFPS